ncbi:MAG: ABC transporter ATP-binding protein [Oscillospiraceae bacterium]|nr:ABC transporter ATP-binding protein [Oscillospiraceae bacterium]
MIKFENVCFSYPGSAPVLEDISFEVKDGEKTGLIGANGAGKSTLMKCVPGLLEAYGKITVSGLQVCRENITEIRKKVGYVLQDPDSQMFMPKVIDDMIFGPVNYGMSREEAEAKADRVLEELGMTRLRDRYNHRISGGEKRMAAIATVLAMEPDVMLMDEPSSSLDPRNRRALINTILALGNTMLIASHDLDMILDTCSRVILLDRGRVIADGNTYNILRDRELLEAHSLELPLSLGHTV